MLSINTNLSSLIAQNSMNKSTNALELAIERMTTGYKINHAKDNAANYSISTNMATQIGSYEVAADNVAMGMDLVTTANDTISLMQDKAERLRALATQARNGTYGAQSMAAINAEASAIMSEINRLYSTAEYNGVSLFTGGTATAETTPEVATFAMRRSAEPEVATFALTRSATPVNTNYDFDNITAVSDAGGAFTESEYKIEDVDDLKELARLTNLGVNTSGVTFILANDIDIGTYCDEEIANGNGGWTPIGKSSSKGFSGTFDGNGHVIKNLKIDRSAGYQGLFGYTKSGSVIKNVGIVGGSVTITGSYSTGGLVGESNSSISNCYATVTVRGNQETGGLVGCSFGSISNSYATGDVTGTGNSVGGLVGRSTATISNCYATGNVTNTGTGVDNVGGLVGKSTSTISNCYATGNVTAKRYYAGGLAGSSSSIDNSYATGDVNGLAFVGGLAGSSSSVDNCYATGNITASNNTNFGGLVGSTSVSVTNSAATQTDSKATVMTEEEIKAMYTPESMEFTEANGWTIINGQPMLSWQKEAQPTPTPDPGPTPTPGGGSSSGSSYGVSAFNLQIGINSDNSCQIGFDINFTYDLSAIEIDIASDEALATIDDFIMQLSEQETKLGAVQNRLESAFDSITVNIQNLTSSLSTIRDADIAEVSSEYIRQQILQQASASLMATANQAPSIALQLI